MSPMRRVHWSQLRIGTMVTLAAFVGALAIFFIDEVRDAVEDRYTLYLYTFTTQTLRPRAPVWLAGQPVGHVQRLNFEPPSRGRDQLLRVELSISGSARPFITDGAAAQIITSGLIGEVVVNILPAEEPAAPLPDRAELTTVPELDPTQILADLRALYDSVPELRTRWQRLVQQARTGDGTLARLLGRPRELTALPAQFDALGAAFDTLGLAAGRAAEFMTDPEMRGALNRVGQRLEQLAATWQEERGVPGALARDTLLAPRLRRMSGTVARIGQRLETGRGSLGRFVNDRALADELARTREMLRELRGEARGGPRRPSP